MKYDQEPGFRAPLLSGPFDPRTGAPPGSAGGDDADAALHHIPNHQHDNHSLTTPSVTTDDAMAWHAIPVPQNNAGSAGIHAQNKLYDGVMPFTGTPVK